MLDGRFHRLAFALLAGPAVVLAAFSLRPSVLPRTAALAPDAFDGAAARADARALAAIPDRSPGSSGDDAAARFVAQRLKAAGFRVRTERVESQTRDGERDSLVVTAERTGFLQRKVVIAADRELGGRGPAGVSGTAALIELGRALAGRTLGHSVQLVSTGSGTGGALAGWSPDGSKVVSVLVLGDLSGYRLSTPFAVPWAELRASAAPVALERSVASAIRSETGLPTGRNPALVRLARLALPITTTDQGDLVADGVPAVTLSSSGERGPPAAVSADPGPRFEGFGRAALRIAGVLDGANGDWPGPNSAAIPLRDREMPAWTIRLTVGLMILASLLTAVDGIARCRRRRVPVAESVVWFLSAWPPILLGWAWLLLAAMFGLVHGVPAVTAPYGTVPVSWAAVAGLPVTVALGWLVLRPLARRRHSGTSEPGDAAPAALMLLLSLAAAVVWIQDPLTALLIVPFAHVGPWLLDPLRGPSRRLSLVALVVVLVPLAAVLAVLASDFATGPLGLGWMILLVFAGGSAGVGAGLATSLLVALFVSAVILVVRRPAPVDPVLTTRGPATYAGPGSLGAAD